MSSSSSTDWQKRGDARTKMRMMVKVLLKTYRYPPDAERAALERVIGQAERLAIPDHQWHRLEHERVGVV